MATDLIVDFPPQRSSRTVHFAETSQLIIFKRQDVARHELVYTKEEYDRMNLAIWEDVLTARSARSSRESANEDHSPNESVCLIGIEHLLKPERIAEVRGCRRRCTRAVLTEQAKERDASATSFLCWESIARVSLEQTKKARVRARVFGKLHQKSIRRGG